MSNQISGFTVFVTAEEIRFPEASLSNNATPICRQHGAWMLSMLTRYRYRSQAHIHRGNIHQLQAQMDGHSIQALFISSCATSTLSRAVEVSFPPDYLSEVPISLPPCVFSVSLTILDNLATPQVELCMYYLAGSSFPKLVTSMRILDFALLANTTLDSVISNPKV